MAQDFDITQVFDELEPQRTGGSAFFCRFEVAYGYKVYGGQSQGITDQKETFFPVDPKGSDAAKKAVLEKAKAFAADHGVTTNPAFVAYLRIYKDSVKGRQVTWAQDMTKAYNRWVTKTEDGKYVNEIDQAWIPAANKAGCAQPGNYWGKIVLVPTPTGRTEEYQGEKRPVMLWLPEELYPNEAVTAKKALEAGGSATPAPNVGDIPEGYDAQTWAQYKPQVLADLSEHSMEFVTKTWGLKEEFLTKLQQG